MKSTTTRLDVREDIRAGREPFSRIMAAVARLQAGQELLLLAPFEPKPLLGVLAAQGFSHRVRALPDGDFEVRISRDSLSAGNVDAGEPASGGGGAVGLPVLDVDARGLEPPEPMVRILEASAQLPAAAELHARTDRRPLHLLPLLAERGFRAECSEQPDGSFLTVIRHA